MRDFRNMLVLLAMGGYGRIGSTEECDGLDR